IGVPDGQVPAELAKVQWIDFTESAAVDGRIEQVADAINADRWWRDRHNELTIQAHDWLEGGRDKSTLLRGTKLKEAEEKWLVDPGPHKESPTQLQRDFIGASRHAANRRQRITLGAVLLALAISLALAFVAYVQRGQAIDQRDQATSLALAATASGTGFDTEALRAMEALRRWPTLQARQALTNLLELSDGLIATRPSHPAPTIP